MTYMKCARLSLSQKGSGHMRRFAITLPLSDLRVMLSTCKVHVVLRSCRSASRQGAKTWIPFCYLYIARAELAVDVYIGQVSMLGLRQTGVLGRYSPLHPPASKQQGSSGADLGLTLTPTWQRGLPEVWELSGYCRG